MRPGRLHPCLPFAVRSLLLYGEMKRGGFVQNLQFFKGLKLLGFVVLASMLVATGYAVTISLAYYSGIGV